MIYDYKQKVKKVGYFIWLICLIVGILGLFYLKWYTALILAILVLAISFLFSYLQALKIEEMTGLSIREQEFCYKKTRHLFEQEQD